MTKQKLIDEYIELNRKFKDEMGRELAPAITSALVTGFLLYRARRAQRRGDTLTAIYYIVFWASFKLSGENERIANLIGRVQGAGHA